MPENLNKDRLAQSLAMLYLSCLPKSTPFKISWKENISPLTDSLDSVISKQIAEFSGKNWVPYIKPENCFKMVPQTQILNIVHESQLVSSGTKEGIIFMTQLYPHTCLKELVGDRIPKISAIMKKIPIYPVKFWIQYLEWINKSEHHEKWKRLSKQLDEEYHSISNHAYVESYGLYLGSSLVEKGLSCFFPLLYGTFRMYDSNFFPTPEMNVYPFPVQLVFMQPLHGSILQLISTKWFISENSFDPLKWMSCFAQIVFGLSLVQEVFSFIHHDFHPGNCLYDTVPFDSYLYYVQRSTLSYYRIPTFGKVFKAVDFGRSKMVHPITNHLTVPLMEGNLKGLATRKLESNWLSQDWAKENFSEDLVRIVSSTVLLMKDQIKTALANHTLFENFIRFLTHVTMCVKNGKNELMMEQYEKCVQEIRLSHANDIIRLKKQNSSTNSALLSELENKYQQGVKKCEFCELIEKPYLKNPICNGGIPKQNIKFFNMFKIELSQIPSSEKIYLID